MDQPTFVEGRTIVVGDGILEIEMTREFMARVRQRFGLQSTESPSDDQIRAFVRENLVKVLDRAEG